jgi:hypothetical protein
MGSVMDKEESQRRHTDWKNFDDIGTQLEASPKKLLQLLALKFELEKKSSHWNKAAEITHQLGIRFWSGVCLDIEMESSI